MRGYTGIRFKTEALILMAENPLESVTIDVNKELNQFFMLYSLANYSLVRHGVLSLDDLPVIERAVHANKLLQSGWDEYKAHLPTWERQLREMELRRGGAIDKAIADAGMDPDREYSGDAKERVEQVMKEVNAAFDPQILAVQAKRREYSARAEIGPAVFNYHYINYFKNVAERIAAVTPLTREQETELFAPSKAWHQEWDALVADNGWSQENKAQIVRAFKAQSTHGTILTRESVATNEIIARNWSLKTFDALFPGEQLDRLLQIARYMAYKRAAEHFYTGPIPQMEPAPAEDSMEDAAGDAPRA